MVQREVRASPKRRIMWAYKVAYLVKRKGEEESIEYEVTVPPVPDLGL